VANEIVSGDEIEAWLADWLGTDSELTGLIGARVYPIFLPSLESLPAVTYRRTGTQRQAHMAGAAGITTASFELRCWASSDQRGYLTACRVARVIRLKVDGLQTATSARHYVRRALLTAEYDDNAELPRIDDEVLALCRVLMVDVAYAEVTRNAIGG